MKIKDLVKKLIELPDKNRNVVILDNGKYINFSGFSVDDNNDVELYRAGGDREY